MTETSTQSKSSSGGQPERGDAWNRLRAIIESLADGIVIVDPRGSIRFANPAAARLFNRTTEGLIGTELGTPLVAGETTEMEIVRRGGGDIVYAELRVVNADWEGEQVELVSLSWHTSARRDSRRSRRAARSRTSSPSCRTSFARRSTRSSGTPS
jgi:PAS domain-containing protein